VVQTSQQNSDERKLEDREPSAEGERPSDTAAMNGDESSVRPSSLVPRRSFVGRRASARERLIAAAVGIAITAFFGVFAVAGHNRVDMGRWLGYCGFQQRTGLPCPTCGMTRSALAFAQGNIREAFYTQPAGGLLCSIMVVVALLAFAVAVSGIYFRFIQRFFAEVRLKHMILALLIILAAGWAVTLARALATRT
jgi:hypothetical protein